MSRGHRRLSLRVSDTVLSQLMAFADSHAVDRLMLMRETIIGYIQAGEVSVPMAQNLHPPKDAAATATRSCDHATQARLIEASARF
jgi:hypothetical protein